MDLLLAEYAAGRLPPALHALVASHLEISPRNRPFVHTLEDAVGRELERVAPKPLSHRDDKLAAIFALPEAPATIRAPVGDPVLPPSLRRLIGKGSNEITWRTKLPGLKEYKISEDDEGEAVLYWIRPGLAMPTHTHEGTEATLVLRGGFTDVSGHYRRGDVALADEHLDHRPRADEDEDCICFAVTDAPLRLTGPILGPLSRLFGR